MPALEAPITVGDVEIPNRLYRAPLLECAGTGPDTVDTLVRELEPTAASGVGLIFQGASLVTEEGGAVAPNMTRVHDPAFVAELEGLTDAVHDHGGRIFLQLDHGGLRSLETWHAAYRAEHPHLRQVAVSRPPAALRALDRLGFLDLDVRVLSTAEVRRLAEQFGRCAGYAVDAGYDGVHLAGANMGLLQQFLSPYYNRRDDEFGDGVRFFAHVRDAVREHAGDVPLVTKVPAETAAPAFVRRHLTAADGLRIARRLEDLGFDALVPVEVSTFWDMSLVRGAYPERAWSADDLQSGYAAAFGSRSRARLVAALNRLQAVEFDREPAWNESFCRRVRETVSVPVLCEGGVRTRGQMDRLLAGTDGGAGENAGDRTAPACSMVGMARPFYAEPRLGARVFEGEDALCESCNNCTVPQVTGADGVCRTPSVLRERARLERKGAYDREAAAGTDGRRAPGRREE